MNHRYSLHPLAADCRCDTCNQARAVNAGFAKHYTPEQLAAIRARLDAVIYGENRR